MRALITSVRSGRSSIEVKREVWRIAAATGLSVALILAELAQAGLDIAGTLPL
jgi:hypothetical protein